MKTYSLRLNGTEAHAIELLASAKGVPVVDELRRAVGDYLAGSKKNAQTRSMMLEYPKKVAQDVSQFWGPDSAQDGDG